jgi:hypothetical protein
MVTGTYANCLLRFLISNLSITAGFWPNSPLFFSLFSVTLVTFHEATFNKINDLRGGGLQVEIGRRYRQRIENAGNECVLPAMAILD